MLPPFVPHRLARSPHLQTFFAYYLPQRALRYRAVPREVLLTDGHRLVMHDDIPVDWQPGHRVALLVPGMGGTHASPFMVRIAHKMKRRGIRVFRMDHRGCGAGERLSTTMVHAGRSDDVRSVLEAINELCPDSKVNVVGFSMGGNMVLKSLGEAESMLEGLVEGCIAVAPPIDMHRCVTTSHSRYSRWIANHLWKNTLRREDLRKLALQSGNQQPRDLLEFDARVTAPASGFEDVEQYYELSSAAPVVPKVRIPTLIIASRDDPVINVSIFEQLREKLPTNTRLHVTDSGGHVGFLSTGREDPDIRWLDWRIIDWIEGSGLEVDAHTKSQRVTEI